MSEIKEIKEGDLVTIPLNEYQVVSNTYIVAKKLDKECVLKHPLAPECFIIRHISDLNTAFPSMQNQVEKCLFFARKNKEALGYTMSNDLDALCYFFVIRKDLTPKQRHDLSNICGKIASVVLGNSISAAITIVKQNKALLDDYNLTILNSISALLEDSRSPKTKSERFTLFNTAGFLLAQLSNS